MCVVIVVSTSLFVAGVKATAAKAAFTAARLPVIVHTPVPLLYVAAPLVVSTPAAGRANVNVAVIVWAGDVSTSLTTMSSNATLAAPSL